MRTGNIKQTNKRLTFRDKNEPDQAGRLSGRSTGFSKVQPSLRLMISLILALTCVYPQLNVPAAGVRAYADVYSTDLVGGISLNDRWVEDTPSLEAPCAIIAAADGTVLWERGGDIRVPMASTTKIMTAILAIESADLDRECLVTRGASETGGTSAWLEQGDMVRLYDLLIGLLLPSGNDAAVTIAENLAGTQFDFVARMNEKAFELGMVNTHYIDAHGLDEDGLYSTVRDYLILARYAMRNPVFAEIVAMREATIYLNGRETRYYNTNKLPIYIDGVRGIKTGTNYEADACLVACVEHQGQIFYTVVFGSPTDDSRYRDTVAMLNWAFKHYHTVELINPSTEVGSMALVDWIDHRVRVRAPFAVTVSVFDMDGPIRQEVELENWSGAVSRGQRVGRVIFSQGSEVIATSELVSDETVDEPDFWKKISIRWDRFKGGFSGQPRHAETTIYLPDSIELP